MITASICMLPERTFLPARALTLCLLLLLLLLGPINAQAFQQGTPIPTDSRIKTFVYNQNDVYRLLTHYGYQLNIEFGNEESIKTISVGDRSGWQITPAGNRLFVRGMEDESHTNMTVITDKRSYQFDLYSAVPGQRDWSELVYVVRFYYPEEEKSRRPILPGNMANNPQQPMQGMMPGQMPMMMQQQPAMPMMPAYGMAMPQAAPYYPSATMPMMQQQPVMPMQQGTMGYPMNTGNYMQPMMSAPAYNQFRNHIPPSSGSMPGPQPPPYANAAPQNAPASVVAAKSSPAFASQAPASHSPSHSAPEGFSFQEEIPPLPKNATNIQYSYTGTKALLPDHMYDDGNTTYFYYPPHRSKPRIFLVSDDGSEHSLPARYTNQYLTIQGVYSRMTLRLGEEHACIYNEALPPPPPS